MNDEYKLLLFEIVVNIHKHMALLRVINGIKNEVQSHLLQPLLVTNDFLWKDLISSDFSNIIQNLVMRYFLVNIVEHLLDLLDLNQLNEDFI